MLVSESFEGCEWVSRTLFISFCCPHHFVGSSLQFWNSLTYRWLQGTGNIKDVVYLLSWYILLVEFHTTPISRPGSFRSRWKTFWLRMWVPETFKVLETTTTSTSWVSMPNHPPPVLPSQGFIDSVTGPRLQRCDTATPFECFRDFRRSKSLGIPFANLENPLLYVYIHTYAMYTIFVFTMRYIHIYISKVSIYPMVCHMKSNVTCRPCSKQHKEHFRSKINISILKPIFGWS